MECRHSDKNEVTVKNTLVSLCTQTVKKVGYLFHKEYPTSFPANSLPSSVSFCFGILSDESHGIALVQSLSDLCRWCLELGIKSVLAYDKAGILKRRKYYLKTLLPGNTVLRCCGEDEDVKQESHSCTDDSRDTLSECSDQLEVILMDSADGRPLLSKVARRIAEDRRSCDLNHKLLMEYIHKGLYYPFLLIF